MKKKGLILPLTVFGMLLSLSLAGCNNNNGGGDGDKSGEETPASQPASEDKPSSAKLEKINITSEGNVKSILYGQTLQLNADQEGVTCFNSSTTFANRSN